MIKLFRYLFVVQYNYHDSLNTMRARALLVFASGAMLVLFAIIPLALLSVFPQDRAEIREYVLIIPAVAGTVGALSVWLIQRGQLRYAILLMGAMIIAFHILDVMISGTMTTGVIFPMVVVYASLTFGTRGATLGYIYSGLVLIAMLVIRSDGLLGTDEIENLPSIVFYTAVTLSIITLLLWLFTGSLQQALVRATRTAAQTRATAEVGQVIGRILNVDELVTRAVELIRDRFAIYHVQIFIVDDAHAHANLVASTGSIGQTLLAQGYRLPISPHTVVGEVIATGEARYIADITDTAYRRLESLEDTRTELAVPLIVGENVLGALDVHSMRADTFSGEDIEALRVVAQQIGQSIQNAQSFESQQQSLLQNRRLFLESETSLREIERLNRQLTGQSWQEYMLERSTDYFGVQMVGQDVQAGPVEWTPAMQQATDRHRMVIQDDEEGQTMAVPVTIRGQPIGAIEVRLSSGQSQTEVRNIVQAVAERMAFSLENVRLFEQARLAAEREQQINRITSQLQGLTSIEDVLATAINTLAQTLDAEHGMVRLVSLDAIASSEDSSNGGQSTARPPTDDKWSTQPSFRHIDLPTTEKPYDSGLDDVKPGKDSIEPVDQDDQL